MKENVVKEKSFRFAMRIVRLFQYMCQEKKETEYLTAEQFESINKDAVEIFKLITSIIKSVKLTINN